MDFNSSRPNALNTFGTGVVPGNSSNLIMGGAQLEEIRK